MRLQRAAAAAAGWGDDALASAFEATAGDRWSATIESVAVRRDSGDEETRVQHVDRDWQQR